MRPRGSRSLIDLSFCFRGNNWGVPLLGSVPWDFLPGILELWVLLAMLYYLVRFTGVRVPAVVCGEGAAPGAEECISKSCYNKVWWKEGYVTGYETAVVVIVGGCPTPIGVPPPKLFLSEWLCSLLVRFRRRAWTCVPGIVVSGPVTPRGLHMYFPSSTRTVFISFTTTGIVAVLCVPGMVVPGGDVFRALQFMKETYKTLPFASRGG